MSNELESVTPARQREAATVQHPVPLFDTAKFEHFQRIAVLMAGASLIPEHLRVYRDRNGNVVRPDANGAVFDDRSTVGNCLMVVNQAEKWRVDPFMLAQETFRTPNGQMGYGGKAVAAALYSVHGIKLEAEFVGEPGTISRGIILRGPRPGDGVIVEIDGTVGKWQTKNRDGSVKQNWTNQPDDQLIYRGTRQWCRRHAPEVIMGVVTDDDIDDMSEYVRAARATPVQSSVSRLSAALRGNTAGSEGFSLSNVEAAAPNPAIDGEVLSATDAQTPPDRAETMGETNHGGDHEVVAEPSVSQTTDGQISDSSQLTLAAADKPVSDPSPPSQSDTGTPSDSARPPAPETTGSASDSIQRTEADPDKSKLLAFSDHLLKTESGGPNALKAPAKEWRDTNDRWPPAEDKELSAKLKAIYAAHTRRVVGDITAEECRKQVEGGRGMTRETVNPVEVERHGRTVLTHPAFGQMSIFRTTGRKNLYGSDFSHNHYVSIELHASELERNLAHDWRFGRERLFRINLSESQWSTFVSSFSIGEGVPVTIEEIRGERMPEIPNRDEAYLYHQEKDATLQEAARLVSETRRAVADELNGLPKKKQAPILSLLNSLESKLTSTLPFIAESFDEHMEKRTEKAKVEIHAYLNSAVTNAGLTALKAEAPIYIEDQSKQDSAHG